MTVLGVMKAFGKRLFPGRRIFLWALEAIEEQEVEIEASAF